MPQVQKNKTGFQVVRWIQSMHEKYGKCTVLLISLIASMLLGSSVRGEGIALAAALVAALFVFMATIYAIADSRKTLVTGLILLLAPLLWEIYAGMGHTHDLTVITAPFLYRIPLLVYVSWLLGKYVFQSREIDQDHLIGAACIYIILGLIFANIYALIAIHSPASFRFPENHEWTKQALEADFTYFSLTTLTSLGYGDIVPASGLVRIIAVLQAATGVMYTAITVGRMVGAMHSSGRKT